MKKPILIFSSVIITTILVFVAIFLLVSKPSNSQETQGKASANNVVEITAKTGYSPQNSIASANKPITLRINTKGTYDCSSEIRIPKLNISKQLPADGITDIQIPAQSAGSVIDFTCGMGMYSGKITIS